LRRGILHSDTIGFKLEVCAATNGGAIVGVREEGFFDRVEMRVEDLLGEGESAVRAKDRAD
jgi:hypothetical protein